MNKRSFIILIFLSFVFVSGVLAQMYFPEHNYTITKRQCALCDIEIERCNETYDRMPVSTYDGCGKINYPIYTIENDIEVCYDCYIKYQDSFKTKIKNIIAEIRKENKTIIEKNKTIKQQKRQTDIRQQLKKKRQEIKELEEKLSE